MTAPSAPVDSQRALVVFEHREASGAFRLLSPGFRHCFCLLEEADGWLLLDPLRSSVVLKTLPALPIEILRRHFLGSQRHVASGLRHIAPAQSALWLRPCTCVELVMRAIGLHAGFVLTPRQLFRWLGQQSGWTIEMATRILDDGAK